MNGRILACHGSVFFSLPTSNLYCFHSPALPYLSVPLTENVWGPSDVRNDISPVVPWPQEILCTPSRLHWKKANSELVHDTWRLVDVVFGRSGGNSISGLLESVKNNDVFWVELPKKNCFLISRLSEEHGWGAWLRKNFPPSETNSLNSTLDPF